MAFSIINHTITVFFVFFLCVSSPVEGRRTRNNRAGSISINYNDALKKSIMFFEGQRSGKLPKNGQLITWRGDSALNDGKQDHAQMDLTGGYYDAGDNIKFNFPMAFTTTMLSWGAIEYAKQLNATGEMKNTMTAIRWGTDYLLKCSSRVKSGVLFVGIADPNKDHACWQRPEDMTTDRKVVSVTVGSDVAGETAAALAAASIVFRMADRKYSRQLLATAKDVMQFALNKEEKYSDQIHNLACPFYCSYSGFKDELLWGGAWLYKATKDSKYLNLIKSLGANEAVNIVSWDNKFGAAYVLLSGQYLMGKKNGISSSSYNKYLQPFQQAAENFICKLMPNGGSQYTRGGLFYYIAGSNLQYVTAMTFMLTTYAKYQSSPFKCGDKLVKPYTLQTLAKKQVDYILGQNPKNMSYMVGYGPKYPRRIHHRGASSPPKKTHPALIECQDGFKYLHTQTLDPNILIGAIVGGPDNNDEFEDNRDNYAQSEPTTYINAAMVGPLAYFAASSAATKK